ncbi:MAG: hypothetical protein LBQ89_01975 [Treponema sp.]|jgi:hypothetical protein|nr:hypothetical protein [Treponema sp.]
MSLHVTKYKTENGKTRRVKEPAAKQAGKNGAPDKSGADNKNSQPENPAKQGA